MLGGASLWLGGAALLLGGMVVSRFLVGIFAFPVSFARVVLGGLWRTWTWIAETWSFGIEAGYEVGTAHALEFANDLSAFFGFVPEEEHALLELVLGADG